MTRELAMVHAREGIRINSLCPLVTQLSFLIPCLTDLTVAPSRPVSLSRDRSQCSHSEPSRSAPHEFP